MRRLPSRPTCRARACWTWEPANTTRDCSMRSASVPGAQKLPPLRLSSDVCGRVTRAAAAAHRPDARHAGGRWPVRHRRLRLSSALLDENQLGMTFGTWGINQYVSPTPVVDNVFMTSRYCVPGYYLMLEGSATSAGNLEWFLAQFFRGEAESARRSRSRSVCADQCVGRTDCRRRIRFALPAVSVRVERRGRRHGLPGRAFRAPQPPAYRPGRLRRGRLWPPVALGAAAGGPRDARRRSAPAAGLRGATCGCRWRPTCFSARSKCPTGMELGALGAAMCAAVAVGLHADYPAACAAMTRCSRRF